MPRSPKPQLLAAALAGLALGAPAAAHAADRFAAVTDGDRLVQFHSDTVPQLSRAVAIRGLPAGERLVALDARPSAGDQLVALGASGTVFSLDAGRHAATGTLARLGAAVPAGTPAALSVAPDGRSARVIAGGRDRTIDLATGAVTADTPAAATVAADLGADGVLRGVDPATNDVVTLDAAGEHVVAPLAPLHTQAPTSVTTAADGATWIATGVGHHRGGQSRLVTFDPATGRLRGHDPFLPIALDAIAATGTAPDDMAAPRVSVRVPAQDVRSALKRHGFLAIVTTSEGGQTLMSARVGSKYRGFGLGTAYRDQTMRIVASSRQSAIRASAGRRIRLHLAVHDYAGHVKLVDRWFTLRR